VPPAAATRAWAERARRAGAEIVVGAEATVAQHPADVVIVAAGPWTPHALGAPGWRPVGPLWGVVAQVALATPPRHAIEQAGVEALTDPDNSHDSLFSIVTLNDASAVGSTFTPAEPEPATVAPRLLERGARYVPALERATIEAVRACARPLSIDGRPLIGPVGDGVHVLTGHGPWGVSLGPGSAQLLADVILGRRSTIPPELAAARFPAP
jgi:glycine/D-amino acid oxidase-like deaminating enzyme